MAYQSDVECNVYSHGIKKHNKINHSSIINTSTLLQIFEEIENVDIGGQAASNYVLSLQFDVMRYSYVSVKWVFTRKGGIHCDAGTAMLAHQRTQISFAALLR